LNWFIPTEKSATVPEFIAAFSSDFKVPVDPVSAIFSTPGEANISGAHISYKLL
jgi:hypothetical protein